MSKKSLDILTLTIGLVLLDGLLCLVYFWADLLCYTFWLPNKSITFFAAVKSAEVNWYRPGLPVLVLIGILSPLITFLPLAVALPFRRRLFSWVKVVLGLVWLGEIFALGFFIPLLT